ncbi:hypothetical protein XANCAGTX0491_000501 [Xanthoria calcicola]
MKNKPEHRMNPNIAKVVNIILLVGLVVCLALVLLSMLLVTIVGNGKGDVGGKEEEEENSTPSSGAGAVCEGK